jgi:peptide deformylase
MSSEQTEQPEEVDEAEESDDAEESGRPSKEELREWRAAAMRIVRQFPDPVLRNPAAEVREFDDDVRTLVQRLGDVMKRAHGVGLAAPQIGVSRRVLVYRAREDDDFKVLVNPRFVEKSEETDVDTEGCLSLLGGELTVPVERHTRVRVSALDGEGEALEFDAEGFEARVIQHEVDHLDGVLMVDRAPQEDRRGALRELRLRAG